MSRVLFLAVCGVGLCVAAVCVAVCGPDALCAAHRSRGAPWPRWRSVSVGGRSGAACPAGPGPRDSPGAGSLSVQTVPSASCSVCTKQTHKKRHTQLTLGLLIIVRQPTIQLFHNN